MYQHVHTLAECLIQLVSVPFFCVCVFVLLLKCVYLFCYFLLSILNSSKMLVNISICSLILNIMFLYCSHLNKVNNCYLMGSNYNFAPSEKDHGCLQVHLLVEYVSSK